MLRGCRTTHLGYSLRLGYSPKLSFLRLTKGLSSASVRNPDKWLPSIFVTVRPQSCSCCMLRVNNESAMLPFKLFMGRLTAWIVLTTLHASAATNSGEQQMMPNQLQYTDLRFDVGTSCSQEAVLVSSHPCSLSLQAPMQLVRETTNKRCTFVLTKLHLQP